MVQSPRKCNFNYLGKAMENETFFFKKKIVMQ